MLRYVEWLANGWLLHPNFRVFCLKSTCFYFQPSTSALHANVNYTEEELKVTSKFFFCSLCETISVACISYYAHLYYTTLEPGSSRMLETADEVEHNEEVNTNFY